MPDLIHSLLTNEVFRILARLVLTSFFWISGVRMLLDPAPIMGFIRSAELPLPRLIFSGVILTLLGGSALLVSNVSGLGWLGAGWLGVFTFLCVPLVHPFWKSPPPKNMSDLQMAMEHLTVIGGMMCAAALLAG